MLSDLKNSKQGALERHIPALSYGSTPGLLARMQKYLIMCSLANSKTNTKLTRITTYARKHSTMANIIPLMTFDGHNNLAYLG